jgi:hypothetical protein
MKYLTLYFIFEKNEVNSMVKCGGMLGEGRVVADQGLNNTT